MFKTLHELHPGSLSLFPPCHFYRGKQEETKCRFSLVLFPHSRAEAGEQALGFPPHTRDVLQAKDNISSGLEQGFVLIRISLV